MLRSFIVAGALALAVPALAQTTAPMTNSPTNTTATVPRTTSHGGPGAVNSGPGSTGTISTEATGAGNISNNPAGAGNASQPAKAGSTQAGSQ
jgi:hypothetical protein